MAFKIWNEICTVSLLCAVQRGKQVEQRSVASSEQGRLRHRYLLDSIWLEDALTETIIFYAFCLGSKIVTLGLSPCSVDLYEILNEICKAAESFL